MFLFFFNWGGKLSEGKRASTREAKKGTLVNGKRVAAGKNLARLATRWEPTPQTHNVDMASNAECEREDGADGELDNEEAERGASRR